VVVGEHAARPIGMFDSGVGGLTVARAVIDLLPHENLVYFGDTARCPYGPRPREEIRKFALEIMDSLVQEGVKVLVVACNAAASVVLEEARRAYRVPVVSVIEPGVRAAIAATRNGRVGVIGTRATITSGAYESAFARLGRGVELSTKSCPLFVDFVERGDTTSEDLVRVAHEYLEPLKARAVDTLLLACTHYPLLAGVIRYVMGPDVVLISSADPTAAEVYAQLTERGLLNRGGRLGEHRFVASSEGIFSELGAHFLGPEFGSVEHRPWDRS